MDVTVWLAWIIVGAVVGWFASMVIKTRFNMLLDVVVGIVGAVIGGFLFNTLSAPAVVGFSVWSLVIAFIGAVILLGLYKLAIGRSNEAY